MLKLTPSTACTYCLSLRSTTRLSHGAETSKTLARSRTSTSGALMDGPSPCASCDRLLRQVVQPAGGARGARLEQLRALGAAAREGMRAARVERTTARDGGEARHRAVDLQQALAVLVHCRD